MTNATFPANDPEHALSRTIGAGMVSGRASELVLSGSWTSARWLSSRLPSPPNVSHRPVSASPEPPGQSPLGLGCF
jgi:hypothetical protein